MGKKLLLLSKKLAGIIPALALFLAVNSVEVDEYFNSVVYHYRGDYWTYSLDPK